MLVLRQIRIGTAGQIITWGSGSPEGVVTAPVGSMYLRSDGGTGTTIYNKESGSGNTGWVADSATGSGQTYAQVRRSIRVAGG